MKEKGIDPVEAITKCKQRGMAEMIEIGLHPEDLAKRRALVGHIGGIYFSSGFSPAHAVNDNWQQCIQTLTTQAKVERIAAIGELGLDWHWNYGTKGSQIALMNAQLDIAKAVKLPVIIHNREADIEMLDVLRNAKLETAGVMHCFSSDYEMAKHCIDLGFFISFAGNVTYKNAEAIQNAARKIPIESVLVETDAPFLSPQAVRGIPNTPEYIPHTYEFLASLRGESSMYVAEKVRDNLSRFLQISAGPTPGE